MARGTIYITAEAILRAILQLGDAYQLQDIRTVQSVGGQQQIVFVVEVPELPGREDVTIEVLPVYESKQDEDGTRWYRLKEVRTV